MLLARSVDVFVEDLFNMTFLFKTIKNLQRCGDVLFDILITSKRTSALGMFSNISKLQSELK